MAYFNPMGGAYGPGPTHGTGPAYGSGFGRQHDAMPPPRNKFGMVGRLVSMAQKYVDRKAERQIDFLMGLGAQLDQERQYRMTGTYEGASVAYGQHHVANDHISPQLREMIDAMRSEIASLQRQLATALEIISTRLPPGPTRPDPPPAPGGNDHGMRQPMHAAPRRETEAEAELPPPPLPPRPRAHVDAAQARVPGAALSRAEIERWRSNLPSRATEQDCSSETGTDRSDGTTSAASRWPPKSTTRAKVRREPVPQATAGAEALSNLELRAAVEALRDGVKAKLELEKDGREAAIRILR